MYIACMYTYGIIVCTLVHCGQHHVSKLHMDGQAGGTAQHDEATCTTNRDMPVAPMQRKPSRRSSITSFSGKRRKRKRAYLPPAFQV